MTPDEDLKRSEWAFREVIRRAKEQAWEQGYGAGMLDDLLTRPAQSNPYREDT